MTKTIKQNKLTSLGISSLRDLFAALLTLFLLTGPCFADSLDELFQNLTLGYDATDGDVALSAGELDVEGKGVSMAGTYYIKEVDIDLMGFQFNYSAETDHGVFTPYLRLEWIREGTPDPGGNKVELLSARDKSMGEKTPSNAALSSVDDDHFNFGIGLISILPYGIMAFVDYEAGLGVEDLTSHLISVGLRLEY